MTTAQQFLGFIINVVFALSLVFLAIALIAFISKRQSQTRTLTKKSTTPKAKAPLSQLTVSIDEESASTSATPPQSPSSEVVEEAQQSAENQTNPSIDLEEEAPEADLAPPAEPIGDSDPKQRQEL